MQTFSEIRRLLSERNLRPRKRFGQNFLHDQNQIRRLVDAAGLKPRDLVLEVGPGTGALTEALLDRDMEVVACEIDRDLAALLRERFGMRIALIEGDCLEGERQLNGEVRAVLAGRPFKLVANLPYNVASPLMACLLIEHPECVGQFVTIQREVADRLLAKPNTKEYGPLTIIVQAMAAVERVGTLSPSCFWPQPQVTSSMVSIVPRSVGETVTANRPSAPSTPTPLTKGEGRDFARFVTTLFTKRRKQLGTILGRDWTRWPQANTHGITPNLRPEALDTDQLLHLWPLARTSPPSGFPLARE